MLAGQVPVGRLGENGADPRGDEMDEAPRPAPEVRGEGAGENIDLDVIMMQDWFDCIPDYYTPVLITSEETIAERPDVVRRFLKAVSRGYQFAIDNPQEAAEILLAAVPELDSELVHTSQAWISPHYQAEAARWGEQSFDVWRDYTNWMLEHAILAEAIDVDAALPIASLP